MISGEFKCNYISHTEYTVVQFDLFGRLSFYTLSSYCNFSHHVSQNNILIGITRKHYKCYRFSRQAQNHWIKYSEDGALEIHIKASLVILMFSPVWIAFDFEDGRGALGLSYAYWAWWSSSFYMRAHACPLESCSHSISMPWSTGAMLIIVPSS